MNKFNISSNCLCLGMPQINIYLNKEEKEAFDKLCKEEDCSPYAMAKQLVLGGINAFRGEKNVREGKNGSGTEERGQSLTKVSY